MYTTGIIILFFCKNNHLPFCWVNFHFVCFFFLFNTSWCIYISFSLFSSLSIKYNSPRKVLRVFISCVTSFMNATNTTLPCGSPEIISTGIESHSCTLSLSFRSVRNELIQAKTRLSIPVIITFMRRRLWGTTSNALVKSITTASILPQLFWTFVVKLKSRGNSV